MLAISTLVHTLEAGVGGGAVAVKPVGSPGPQVPETGAPHANAPLVLVGTMTGTQAGALLVDALDVVPGELEDVLVDPVLVTLVEPVFDVVDDATVDEPVSIVLERPVSPVREDDAVTEEEESSLEELLPLDDPSGVRASWPLSTGVTAS